jgi:23S rRNA pseudouridine1911/1915/1917 synthase
VHATLDQKQKTGARADWLVHQAFPQLTGNQVDEAIETGLVRLVGPGSLKKGTRLTPEQTLDCEGLETRLAQLRLGNPDLKIAVVHEEPTFWVVDKPAGMPGHPLRLAETQTVTHWALAQDPELARYFPQAQPTLTPHRLDTGTSGLLVVCRTPAAYETWRGLFQDKQVSKAYLAWCWGVADRSTWVIENPIGKAKGEGGRMAVDGRDFREATSTIKVLNQLSDRFLAEVRCETGVTHQVRVHLSFAGFPLIGDRAYDPDFSTRSDQPAHHLLRAAEIGCELARLKANSATFSALF